MLFQKHYQITSIEGGVVRAQLFDIIKAYNPNEPRGEHGRWSSYNSGPSGKHLRIQRLQSRLVDVSRALQNHTSDEEWDKLSFEAQQIESQLNLQPLGPDYIYGNGGNKWLVRHALVGLPGSERSELKNLRVENHKRVTSPENGRDYAGLAWGSHKIQVADTSMIPNWHRPIMTEDIPGVTIHEVGHIRDTQLGRPSEDLAPLIKMIGSDNMTTQEMDYAKYYFSNSHEMWAELYRTGLGTGEGIAFGLNANKAKYMFKSVIKEMYRALGL